MPRGSIWPRWLLWVPSHLSQPPGGLGTPCRRPGWMGSRPRIATHAIIDSAPQLLYTHADIPLRTIFVSGRSFLWLLNTRPVGPAGRSSGGELGRGGGAARPRSQDGRRGATAGDDAAQAGPASRHLRGALLRGHRVPAGRGVHRRALRRAPRRIIPQPHRRRRDRPRPQVHRADPHPARRRRPARAAVGGPRRLLRAVRARRSAPSET